ncbi:unnamed protein product, partial [Brenthis ino]
MHNVPPLEKYHDPLKFTTPMTPYIKGTNIKIHDPFLITPDYRVEEPFYLPRKPNHYYNEDHRPYRLSPHYMASYRWNRAKGKDNIHYLGCYCTTVYKRLTPLAGCAVITTRHILTTATSTHLILRDKLDFPTLENILGAWYDTNHNNFNSSMYLSPARIHYHPLWHYPEQVNRSHPFSFTFDLAVWAATYNVYGWYFNSASAIICLRSTSHWFEQRPPTPPSYESYIIVGFQYMFAYKRIPTPWHKYGTYTHKYAAPCPKNDWGWFVCAAGDWAKYGIESGAACHRTYRGHAWMYDGLLGLGAFSMKLRSEEIVHYFTVLDTHIVLDFLHDAYESNIPYIWLDERFEDTKHAAPRVKSGYYVSVTYQTGEQWEYYPDK